MAWTRDAVKAICSVISTNRVRSVVSAIDLNAEHVNFAKKQFPYFDYQVANLCDLPFPDDTFDFVMSTEVLEHLPHPGQALTELKRIAKPEAHLIISVPFAPFFHWGNLLRGKYWKRGGYTPDHGSSGTDISSALSNPTC